MQINQCNRFLLAFKQNPLNLHCNFKHFLSTNGSSRNIHPYNITNSRREQVLNTKPRLNCSLLNAQLHSRNIVKSPNCFWPHDHKLTIFLSQNFKLVYHLQSYNGGIPKEYIHVHVHMLFN